MTRTSTEPTNDLPDYLDVLIVGAGLSGIGAACHLRRQCPDHSIALLEARDSMGGTWDLFRYPGIRSDSDMHTLGYNFKLTNLQAAVGLAQWDALEGRLEHQRRLYRWYRAGLAAHDAGCGGMCLVSSPGSAYPEPCTWRGRVLPATFRCSPWAAGSFCCRIDPGVE